MLSNMLLVFRYQCWLLLSSCPLNCQDINITAAAAAAAAIAAAAVLVHRPIGTNTGYLKAKLPIPQAPTNKVVELPPQTSSLTFNDKGEVRHVVPLYMSETVKITTCNTPLHTPIFIS